VEATPLAQGATPGARWSNAHATTAKEVTAVIESMNAARLVHDTLESPTQGAAVSDR
jgi:hypothetical protein